MIEFLPKEPYKRVFVVVFYATIACALFYLFFRFFWMPLLPFFLALLLSSMIRPVVQFLYRKFRIPVRLCTVLLLLLLIFGLLLLSYLTLLRLVEEAGSFLAQEVPSDTGPSQLAGTLQNKLGEWFPAAKEYFASKSFGAVVRDALSGAASGLVAAIPGILSSVLGCLPLLLFFVVVLMIASYYLTTDRERIFKGLYAVLPDRIVKEMQYLRRRAGDCLWQYLKAALILLVFTFLQLFLGFTLLRIPYSLTLAAIIAVIDFFPILGTGTVMIPWAIVRLLSGDMKSAIGLLVLWALITASRQAIEPRIIGKKLGLHPFHALASMYFGFSLFGFTGLILAPLAVTVLLGVVREKRGVSATDARNSG